MRILALIPLLMAGMACSTLSADTRHTGGPGTLYYSVENAALAAMTHAYSLRFPRGRPQILAGTIARVPGGFSYTAPTASTRESPYTAPSLRHQLTPSDEASYLVYTRLGFSRADRAMESPRAVARRIVDDIDAQHRPVYLLTPSLDIVTYEGDEFRFFAHLGDSRPVIAASE